MNMALKSSLLAAFLLLAAPLSASALTSDLNSNGIPDQDESDVVVTSNRTLPAGSYTFHNLTISNNAILEVQGDATGAGFKGVQLNADNLTVAPSATINADGQGYGSDGPGSSSSFVGSSYGGTGESASANSIYGSAMQPTDLGSGGSANSRGGGALRIIVTGTLQNDGTITAGGIGGGDHMPAGSGGSIYITTNTLSGTGFIEANGGFAGALPAAAAGGGGRIAVYYQNSSFSGTTQAKGGQHFICFGCGIVFAHDGSVGFFNTSTNDAFISSNWTFQNASSPFAFNVLTISGTSAGVEDGVTISAKNLLLTNSAKFSILNSSTISIPQIKVQDTSTLTLSDETTLNTKDMSILGGSVVTSSIGSHLNFSLQNLKIDANSSLNADGKGYAADGPGSPSTSGGGSYGGAGEGRGANSIYGSDLQPTDFGSGGLGGTHGGGAIRLDIVDTLQDDGFISSDGESGGSNQSGGSGGSIFITTNNLAGSGFIGASGAFAGSLPQEAAGGGGRVAVYYRNSTFTSTSTNIVAKGGQHFICFGCGNAFAHDGTIIFKQKTLSISSLNQLKSDGATLIPEGATTDQNKVIFQATISGQSANQIQMEVEVKPSGIPFTNSATVTSDPISSGNTIDVSVPNLSDGAYHWQARIIDLQGNASAWQSLSNPAQNTDFKVQQRQIIFAHGIIQSFRAIANGTGGFQSLITSLESAGYKVNFLDYYQDAGYSVNGKCQLSGSSAIPQPLPDQAVGQLYASKGIDPSICDSQSAIAYDSTRLFDELSPLHAPITVIAYSMGMSAARGWMVLAQASTTDATLKNVDTVISLQGANQGSYLAGIDTSVLPISNLANLFSWQGLLFSLVVDSINKILPVDAARPAVADLSPGSAWYSSVNSVTVPANLHYFSFYSNIQATVYPQFFVTLNPIGTVSFGDDVLLPGDTNSAAMPMTGGARFLPGGVQTSDKHEYQIASNHALLLGNDILTGLITDTSAVSQIASDPVSHLNLMNNLTIPNAIMSCKNGVGQTSVQDEIMRIVGDPSKLCS